MMMVTSKFYIAFYLQKCKFLVILRILMSNHKNRYDTRIQNKHICTHIITPIFYILLQWQWYGKCLYMTQTKKKHKVLDLPLFGRDNFAFFNIIKRRKKDLCIFCVLCAFIRRLTYPHITTYAYKLTHALWHTHTLTHIYIQYLTRIETNYYEWKLHSQEHSH